MRPFIALASLLILAAGQQQQPPPFIQTYEVRVSNLDVIVTDRAGKSVTGLPADVFEVIEEGRPQQITNFAEYVSSKGVASGPTTDTATQARSAVADVPAKHLVFFIDELVLHPNTRSRLLKAASELIDTMQPGDEATVITSATAEKVSLPFTSDVAAVRKSLEAALHQGGFRTNTTLERERIMYQTQVRAATGRRERRDAARRYSAMVNRRVTSTLSAMRALVASLAPKSGRKVLMVISESLTAQPGREAFTLDDVTEGESGDGRPQPPGDGELSNPIADVGGKILWYDARPAIKEVGALAASAGVTIYTLQPEPGIDIGAVAITEGVGRAARRSSQMGPSANQQEVLESTRVTLGSLADATGGKYFNGTPSFHAFTEINSDLQAYYSIGYRPSDPTSDAVRNVVVRIRNRPDLRVRSRRAIMRPSQKNEMNDLVTSALLYPRDVDALKISAEASKPVRVGSRYKVDVTVHIPIGNLTFVPVGDKFRGQFTVHYAVSAEDASFSAGMDREQKLESDAAGLEAARTKSFTYTSSLMIGRGTARIAVGVQDPLSRLTSLKTLTVNAN